jgi:hypothetical protein
LYALRFFFKRCGMFSNWTTGLNHLEKGQPRLQMLISTLLRKSRQHFITCHFFRAHKSRTEVPSCTSSAVRKLVGRRPSVLNLSQCHIKWSTISFKHIKPWKSTSGSSLSKTAMPHVVPVRSQSRYPRASRDPHYFILSSIFEKTSYE